MKKIAICLALILGATSCTGDPQADVASENISTAAENFEILRRIVFINGITDQYLLEVTGYCSIDRPLGELRVTCRGVDGLFKRHHLGLADNISYVIEQLDGANVSTDFYRVIYRPQTLIPDVDLGG